MFFDFCISEHPVVLEEITMDTIFYINGDEAYMTPYKRITPGKTYFVYTLKGEGVINCDGHTLESTENSFVFMQPKQSFSYWCKHDSWEFWWFEFTGPCRWATDTRLFFPCDHLTTSLMTASLQYAKRGEWEIAASMFLTLARVMTHEAMQPKKAASNDLIVSAAERYIRSHLDSVTVQELADELGLQERTLRNIFYSTLDLSPKGLITRIRMNVAGYMLTSTDHSLEEIAQHLGYSSQYHLSACFREHFGVTPIRYRKLIQVEAAQ